MSSGVAGELGSDMPRIPPRDGGILRPMVSRNVLAYCLVFVLGACGGASKQQAAGAPAPDPAAAAAEKESVRLFEEGKVAYAAGDLDKAIASWEAGYAAKPNPTFQYNLGQAHN